MLAWEHLLSGESLDREYAPDFRPHPEAYPCKLVLLCDRGTASAASWIATYVKDLKIGLIVGEETGGVASFSWQHRTH